MDRMDVDLEAAVREPSRERFGVRESVADCDPNQEAELLRMVSKMLALYPKREDVEVSLEAFVDELKDIPWRWVSRGLRLITEEPNRVFGPSISEVKTAIARCVQSHRRKVSGGSLPEDAAGIRGVNATRELDWLLDKVSEDLRRGLLPPGVTVEDMQRLRLGRGGR